MAEHVGADWYVKGNNNRGPGIRLLRNFSHSILRVALS